MSKGDKVTRGKIMDNLKSCHLVTHSLAMTKKDSNNDHLFIFGNNNLFLLLDQWWRLNHHPLED
jgi:hypothetical protein